MFSRYFTYAIQFLNSVMIAVKLGPYYFGIWGFILLLLNYFRIIDFGISNATNILIVQNRDDRTQLSPISSNAIYLVSAVNFIVIIFCCYYYFVGSAFFDKYSVNAFIWYILIVAVITNYNVLFMNLYRVQNSLKEISLFQSMVPLIMFVITFFFTGKELLDYLIFANVFGGFISFIIFIKNGKIPKLVKCNIEICKIIMNKGFYLFIYSISFYLIILSIKTLISIYYSVNEFGLFSFSYTLGNSVLLFLQALTFIVFPKIIDKLKGTDFNVIRSTLNSIRISYVSMAFGLVFAVLMLFPFLLGFIPKYKDSFSTLSLVMLTVVLYTNSFGYGTFLMAQNFERINALISFLSLVVNVLLALFLILFLRVQYQYVILATIGSYILYTFLCVYFGKRKMNLKEGFLKDFEDCFPLRLLVPFVIAIVFIFLDLKYYMLIPFLVFMLFNLRSLREIGKKIRILLNKPNVVDL